MGSWSATVSGDDFYQDIRIEFFKQYDRGIPIGEITAALKERHKQSLAYQNQAHSFWYAIAQSQWDCGQLDKKVLETVDRIITSGLDQKTWAALGASKHTLANRKKATLAFLKHLRIRNRTPRVPAPENIEPSPQLNHLLRWILSPIITIILAILAIIFTLFYPVTRLYEKLEHRYYQWRNERRR